MNWGLTTSKDTVFSLQRDSSFLRFFPMEYKVWLICLECLVSERIQGVLADILEPIMGKGLIPADLETWKVRRRGLISNGLTFRVVNIDDLFYNFSLITVLTHDLNEMTPY